MLGCMLLLALSFYCDRQGDPQISWTVRTTMLMTAIDGLAWRLYELKKALKP